MAKIKADFKQGDKITEIPASWFNSVASFINNLVGVNNIAVKRPHGPVTESSPVEIEFIGEAGTTLNLSDATPQKDASPGAAGTATTASRADHKHPLNVPASGTPEAIGDAGAQGDDTTYSRFDHVHSDKRARTSGYTITDISLGASPTPGPLAPGSNGWNVSSNTTGVKVSVLTRIRYSESDATPSIHFYYRTMTYDPCGRLLDVSTEGRVTVHVPVAVTIG